MFVFRQCTADGCADVSCGRDGLLKSCDPCSLHICIAQLACVSRRRQDAPQVCLRLQIHCGAILEEALGQGRVLLLLLLLLHA
eukprot:scaffold6196_cov17-Tisochrysis_lutea.AAC.5